MSGISVAFGVLAMLLCCYHVRALEEFNVTENDELLLVLTKSGRTVYMPESLLNKLNEEQETWHWTPWLRTRVEYVDNIAREMVARDSIESFPDGIFTDEQLRKGGFIIYLLFAVYAFTLLAVVCNDYFIPCVEIICEDLKIPQNVAAATFMSVATSCPEFFVNVISTFLTQSDMGIGTIVGSAIFNALGVAAIGSIAAITPIAIDARPVTRDVIIYMFNVSVLVVIVWDGQVDWYEALVLGILYILYFVFMFNSMKLFGLLDKLIEKCRGSGKIMEIEQNSNLEQGIDNKGFTDDKVPHLTNNEKENVSEKATTDKDSEEPKRKCIFRYPSHKSIIYQLGFLYLWPVRFALTLTIPSPITRRKLYPLAFIMCIVWIGINSYFVSWSMTVLGHTFFIPDSVMGMTFLAFGGCLPEAFSIYIMSRRGEGGIGVSNALGANSLAILFALGIPWLIKTLANLAQGVEDQAVLINSSGIDFVVGSLLVAVSCLWVVLFIGKFTLRKSVGIVLGIMYLIFITFSILVEMEIILDRCVLDYDC